MEMLQYRPVHLSLRIHSLLICLALVVLAALLGWKVLTVARTQSVQMRTLVHSDFRAQRLLEAIEGHQEALKASYKKYWITQDSNYLALIEKQSQDLAKARSELLAVVRIAHPEFTPADIEDTEGTRQRLEALLTQNLADREKDANGMVKLVIFAGALTLFISLWVSDLFFRRLGAPLRMLKQANMQLARGKLDFRIAEPRRGVDELVDLAHSFNRMAGKLEELDRTKYEFLSAVSHEIKNPLAALKEGLALLSRAPKDLPERSRERAVNACLIASKRVETMIENLMHHARLEKGFRDFRMEYTDLGEVIQTAIAQLRPLAEKREIQFQFKPATGLSARLSSEGMTHVIENLLMNAIRYGQEKSEVRIQANRLADAGASPRLQLEVSNRAKFLPTGELDKLFDRFYRANPSQTPSGLGLGLYIVKSIVEAHHGTVRAQTVPENQMFSVQLEIPISEAV